MSDAQSTSHTPMTEARRRANKKYNARFVELKVRLTREERATVKAHAEQMGESVSTFIHRAIDEVWIHDSTLPRAIHNNPWLCTYKKLLRTGSIFTLSSNSSGLKLV